MPDAVACVAGITSIVCIIFEKIQLDENAVVLSQQFHCKTLPLATHASSSFTLLQCTC